MTSDLRRSLARRYRTFPEAARPHVANLIQQLKALETGTGNSDVLPAMMAKTLQRIEEASGGRR